MYLSVRNVVTGLSTLLLIASLVLITNHSHAGNENTVRLDKYGVQVTLPDRWDMEVINKKVRKKLVFAMEARDKRDMQPITLYVRPIKVKKGKEVPVDKWVNKGMVPRFFKGYSEGYQLKYEQRSESQVTTKSGEQVSVTYYQAYIGKHPRQVAFGYLVHQGHYLLFTTMNRGTMLDNKPVVEKSLLPNLVLY